MADRERDRAAHRIFAAALELPADRRQELVTAESGSDVELRLLVERLLSAALVETTVDPLAHLQGPGSLGGEAPLAVGDRVGPYEVVGELGRGGMACVFRAERREGGFSQTVAIKVIASTMASREVATRLGRERQILASLQHPNIATVLDGGALENGSPYLVLEFIDGAPLDVHAASLPLERRLRLMITVARAVQHAHRSLIVHRDLKPSNILVDGHGTVKLLDFGIAKVLALDDPQGNAETVVGMRLLTPQWASPEQVLGEPLTTASDIYQLGLLLFHLCCGATAHRLRDTSWSELRRVICDEPPPRPMVVAQATGSKLSAELEAIILHALEKQPDRRYGAAEDLARDLERLLLRLPISVRPATAWYRFRKLADRHRVATSVGIIAVLALLVTLGGLAIQTRRLARQRDVANVERLRAQQIGDFLGSLFVGSPLSSGKPASAADLVARGAERIDRELMAAPEIRYKLLIRLAQASQSLGAPDTAAPLARRVVAETAPLGPFALERAYALLLLADAKSGAGELSRAEVLFRAAIAAADGVRDQDPELALNARRAYAKHLERANRLDAAEALARQVVAQRRALGQSDALRADDLRILGSILIEQGQIEEAMGVLREARRLRAELFGEDDPRVIRAANDLAFAVEEAGGFEEAEALRRSSLAAEEQLLRPDDPALATARHNLARVLFRQGKLEEAASLARRAVESLAIGLGPHHAETLLAQFNWALSLRELRQTSEAANVFAEQIAPLEKMFGPDHPRARLSRAAAGLAALDLGHSRRAAELAAPFGATPMHAIERLLVARLALARGDTEIASGLLADFDQRASGPLRARLRLEGRLWRAMAEDRLGRLGVEERQRLLAAAATSTPRLAAVGATLRK